MYCRTVSFIKSRLNVLFTKINLIYLSSDGILSAVVTAQEYIDNCKYMLEYERQMFLDMCHSDGLLIAAKYEPPFFYFPVSSL